MKTSSDLRPLLDMIKKNGYKIVPSGKHHKVLDGKGRAVIDDNGPLIISSTPGDHRARDMHMKRLKDAGVIKREQDPWKPQPEKEPGTTTKKRSTMSEEQKERIRQATYRKSAENAERTRKIRSRLEPVVAKLGGWDKKGLQANVGLTYFHLLNTLNRVGRPPSHGAAVQQVYKMRKGETLSETSAELFEIYINDLEKGGDPAARFFELQREAKGITERFAGPAPGPPTLVPLPPASESDDPPMTPPTTLVPRHHPAEARIPTQTLRAAALMGRFEQNSLAEIEEICQKLAMYEMESIERSME